MRKVVHSEKVFKDVYYKLDLLKKRNATENTLDRYGTLLVRGRTLHQLSYYT